MEMIKVRTDGHPYESGDGVAVLDLRVEVGSKTYVATVTADGAIGHVVSLRLDTAKRFVSRSAKVFAEASLAIAEFLSGRTRPAGEPEEPENDQPEDEKLLDEEAEELLVWTVSGSVTISVHCKVRARTEKEAIAAAEMADMQTFCHYCASSEVPAEGETPEWRTSGELDGQPAIEAVALED